MRSELLILPVLAAAGIFCGCAAVAVTGAAQGVGYTFTNVAYRTFTFPEDKVHSAALQALKKMQIPYEGNKARQRKGETVKIRARTKELQIKVFISPVTGKATKISVDAKKKLFLKDKAVAIEIINQVAIALGTR